MLSTPEKRFSWARSDKFAHFTFFRSLIQRRPRKPSRAVLAAKERAAAARKWKPAAWTPWLWVKDE
jgi:hypothetical protein